MSQQMVNGSHYNGSVTITNRMSDRYAVVGEPFHGKHALTDKQRKVWYAKFETFDGLEDFIEQQNKPCTIYPPSMCTVPNKKCWLIIILK